MKKPRKPKKPLKEVAQSLAPQIAQTVQDAIPPSEPTTLADIFAEAETVCERARRLAREGQERAKTEREAKETQFLESLFKPGEYTRNEDGTYTICGWKWRVRLGSTGDPYLSFNERGLNEDKHDNFHRGVLLSTHYAYSLRQFGEALLDIDERVEFIDKHFPDTFWGRIRLWFYKQL